MNNKLTHFAIYVDDIARASAFYNNVFGWATNSYGPPDFLQLKTNDSDNGELIGALQDRKYSSVKEKVIGFECSIGVDNVDKVANSVIEAGGEILIPKTEIPYVGCLIKFKDTEGNLVCAIQYQDHINEQMK
ncbi:MAG: VOC family protein [Bacteroidota bacterium]